MKAKLINTIKTEMESFLDKNQTTELENVLITVFNDFEIIKKDLKLSI